VDLAFQIQETSGQKSDHDRLHLFDAAYRIVADGFRNRKRSVLMNKRQVFHNPGTRIEHAQEAWRLFSLSQHREAL
jgi:hypothetical protein